MKAIDINEKAAKEASKVKSSFSGIVYIDGVESSKERMDNLNPDRIASMNVYKGNEAIASPVSVSAPIDLINKLENLFISV